jgi:adenosyl cobinamide kinase/adenosyl cobinamide phosphate guanylyltransferase
LITLLLGGIRSGKSALAERLAGQLPPPVTYLATAAVVDDEHASRVAAHRARRDPTWTTVEAGAGLVGALLAVSGTVLVDSLGSWVAAHDDFAADPALLCAALAGRRGDAVVVSEEVGLSVHPSAAAGRRFADSLGLVNAAVADVCDRVLLVVAGRTLALERPQ